MEGQLLAQVLHACGSHDNAIRRSAEASLFALRNDDRYVDQLLVVASRKEFDAQVFTSLACKSGSRVQKTSLVWI